MEKLQRIVLVPCPFQGHISPMLDMGSALHSKGFSITVMHTHFNSPNPSNHPHFAFSPLDDGLTDSDISSPDIGALVKTLNTKVEALFEERLTELMDQEGITCIIYDTLMYTLDGVVEKLKLPSILFYTCSAAAMTACEKMPRLIQEGYFPVEDSKWHDQVPGVDPLRFKDLPYTKFMSLESQMQLLNILFDIRRVASVILNSIDCLERLQLEELHKKHDVPSFSVGPLFRMSTSASSSLLDADTNCITWLDKQAPNTVLYVSVGSLVCINKEELAEMAWGLANCGQPFLWVVRPGSVHGSQWIELLPQGFEELMSEVGLIVKWAPQKEVLAHEAVGGFWTHCGWNSTLESIYEGVPMICCPDFGDQHVNARYVTHVWKVGLELDGEIQREKIQEVVKRLMADEEGKQIRKRATELETKVKLATLPGGSSYNSLNDLAKYIMSLQD